MALRAGLDQAVIMQTAVRLVDEHGLAQLTMATLAAQLNVRTPTLYHHFQGLAGVRRGLALLGLRQMGAALGHAVMGKAGDEAILALAYALRDFAHEHPGLYEATVRSPEGEDPEWQNAGREVVDIGIRAFSAYHLALDDALHAVRLLRSIVHGWVSLHSAGGFALPLDVDETFHRLLDVFLLYLHKNIPSEDHA